MLELTIESRDYDFLGMAGEIAQYCNKSQITPVLTNRIQLAFEESVSRLLVPSLKDPRIQAVVEYSEEAESAVWTIRYGGPRFDALKSADDLALSVLKGTTEEMAYSWTENDELQNQPSGSAKQNRIRIIAAITKLRQAACNAKLIEPEADVPSAKLETFVQLVQNLVAANHKALVFSQFVRHLDIVRPILDELGVSYQYLDGSTQRKDRADAVEAFQKGDSNLFLISLKAGGLGLNLTRADFVILLDPWWNPAVEDQASDRAHRIGQTKPVTIYRLIAKQTIEEKIIALHNEKRDLAEKILSGTDTPGSITAEELLKLITES